MKIAGINAGVTYTDSTFLPHDFVNAMGGVDENVLKLAITYNDIDAMKSFSSDYYLAYFDEPSKRLAFRAMKLMGVTLELMKEFKDINKIGQKTLISLVETYSDVFNMPLDGLLSFQKIKNMINSDILKDINPIHLPHYSLQLYDIEKGPQYSKIRRFSLSVRKENARR
jgi:hypothetical protein